MTRIAVVGAGYAGLGTAIALAKRGNRVTCVDTDSERVNRISRGRAPFFEKGIDREIGSLTRRGLLAASGETSAVARKSDAIFLCVGTPAREDGSLDSSHLQAASMAVGEGLGGPRRQVVVIKSTVVPGTTEGVVIPTLEAKSGLHAGEFGVCMNPEFLREGRAMEDSLRPSHIVVGELDRPSGNALMRLYAPFRCPKFRTSLRVAEAVKYATNSFLATKVTFANELANLCGRLGLDADEVLKGMTLDPRISPHHLQPGPGFGGSCFPKDLKAIVAEARRVGYEPMLLSAVIAANDRQHLEVLRLLEEETGPLAGKRVALLGLAFKAGTDDIRESKALAIASELVLRGAHVVGYDPRAGANFARAFHGVEVAKTARDAIRGADACIVQAAWPEFSRLRSADFATMANPIVVDARRTWPKNRIPQGIRYRRIG